MIKLTIAFEGMSRYKAGEVILVRQASIKQVRSQRGEGSGSRVHIDDERYYVNVRETPEEILEMLK
jgi:hypothetical protein